MYAKISTKFEREAYFSSPKFEMTDDVKELCLSFSYYMKTTGAKLRVYSIKDGIIFGDKSEVNDNTKEGEWHEQKIHYKTPPDQVFLFFILLFIPLTFSFLFS